MQQRTLTYLALSLAALFLGAILVSKAARSFSEFAKGQEAAWSEATEK